MTRDYYVSLSFPPFVHRYHRRHDDENVCMYTRNKLFTPISSHDTKPIRMNAHPILGQRQPLIRLVIDPRNSFRFNSFDDPFDDRRRGSTRPLKEDLFLSRINHTNARNPTTGSR